MMGSLEIRLESYIVTRWRVRKLTLLYEKIVPSSYKGMFCVNGIPIKDFGVLKLKSGEWFYQTVEGANIILSRGHGVVIPATLPRLVAPKGIMPRYILRVEVEALDKPS